MQQPEISIHPLIGRLHYNCQGRKTLNQWRSVDVCRAFETFDEFVKYRKGNLKNCDLSEAIDLDVDFSKYTTDDTTKLPIREDENLSCKVLKVYKNGEFAVCQFWSNEDKEIVKQQVHRFSYFFDFVAFLKGDLSGADLLFCTGMKNLSNIDGINLSDVKMTSELCEQFNVQYKSYDYDKKLIGEFPAVEKNEEETALVLQSSREFVSSDSSMLFGSFGDMFLWNFNDVGVKTINKFNPIPYSTLKNSYFVVYRRGLGNI